MGFQEDKDAAAGGTFAASYKPNGIGDGFKGEIIDWRKEQGKKYLSEDLDTLPDGSPKYQYVITIQTDFRNWDRCAKPPKDQETGKPLPESEDDGKRNVYIANQKSSNFGDVARAVIEQMPDADDFRDAIGGVLMGKYVEDIDTGKGNPYKKFEYRFEAPKKDGGFQQDAAEESSEAPEAASNTEAPF